MRNHRPQENTARVVALAIAVLAGVIALGAAAGLHTKFAGVELAALGTFVLLFGLATYVFDRGVREWINARLRRAPSSAPAKSPAGNRAAI